MGGGEEQQLAQWTWSIALRLRLHAHAQPGPRDQGSLAGLCDLGTDPSLGSIVRGLLAEQRFSLACYLALAMTKCGHRWVIS